MQYIETLRFKMNNLVLALYHLVLQSRMSVFYLHFFALFYLRSQFRNHTLVGKQGQAVHRSKVIVD